MDSLAPLLEKFQLQAHVFHTGNLCSSAAFPASEGVAYLHSLSAGRLEVATNNRTPIILEAPATIFYAQPISHKLTPLDSDAQANLVCGSIDFGVAGQAVLAKGLPDYVLVTAKDIEFLGPLLSLLFAESSRDFAARQSALNRLCELLVIQLFRHLMNEGKVNGSLLAGLSDPRLSKLLTQLHQFPERQWTLENMANCCGMSRAPFAKRFKEVLGVPPAEYLSHWRLALVQNLLRGGQSVTQASLEVGYESPSAMARAFKQRLGLSPTDWLKAMGKPGVPV